jgi:hypothetical protein
LHNRALGFIGFLVVSIGLGLGCLRAHEHDGPWPCGQHSDCAVGEKCLARLCVPESFCDYSIDCANGQACDEHTCVTIECTNDLFCSPLVCVSYKCVSPDGGR